MLLCDPGCFFLSPIHYFLALFDILNCIWAGFYEQQQKVANFGGFRMITRGHTIIT